VAKSPRLTKIDRSQLKEIITLTHSQLDSLAAGVFPANGDYMDLTDKRYCGVSSGFNDNRISNENIKFPNMGMNFLKQRASGK
jgi:hypothetical protein